MAPEGFVPLETIVTWVSMGCNYPISVLFISHYHIPGNFLVQCYTSSELERRRLLDGRDIDSVVGMISPHQ